MCRAGRNAPSWRMRAARRNTARNATRSRRAGTRDSCWPEDAAGCGSGAVLCEPFLPTSPMSFVSSAARPMTSLADLPELVGFFSYSREDDEGSGGELSALRGRIQHELRAQLG